MSRAPSIASAALAIETSRDADECLAEIAVDGPYDVCPLFGLIVEQVSGIIGSHRDQTVTQSRYNNTMHSEHSFGRARSGEILVRARFT
jgi:hypothetical protein